MNKSTSSKQTKSQKQRSSRKSDDSAQVEKDITNKSDELIEGYEKKDVIPITPFLKFINHKEKK